MWSRCRGGWRGGRLRTLRWLTGEVGGGRFCLTVVLGVGAWEGDGERVETLFDYAAFCVEREGGRVVGGKGREGVNCGEDFCSWVVRR